MDEEKSEGDHGEEKEETTSEPVQEKSEEPVKPLMKTENITDKIRKNPFILSTLVCGALAVLLLVAMISGGGVTGNVVSKNVAGENLIGYLNNVVDSEVTLVDMKDEENFYLATVEFKGEELPIYVTKDGASYTSNLIPLVSQQQDIQDQTSQDVPKSDVPVVELFIMTHCPYGTQAEKGMIPVIESLGDLIDAKIRFVHYFMHEPEETETPRQVCIREEQSEKYLDYLRYFLEEGDSDYALEKAGINQADLTDCVNNRAEGYYEEDSSLSEEYGVSGSPALVINGEIISSARSPAAYLDTICQAFNDVPEECSALDLASESPTPMWGWDSTSAATTASC